MPILFFGSERICNFIFLSERAKQGSADPLTMELKTRRLITVMCNMLELHELIQYVRDFKIFFPNLTIFKVPPKSL